MTEQTKIDGTDGNIRLFRNFRFISFVPLSLFAVQRERKREYTALTGNCPNAATTSHWHRVCPLAVPVMKIPQSGE
ncbi:MAG: hypothetical protein KIT57_07030 [Blastocatellales bacterium]|nr:hypothetical protein [Blastocatellales bacterium]